MALCGRGLIERCRVNGDAEIFRAIPSGWTCGCGKSILSPFSRGLAVSIRRARRRDRRDRVCGKARTDRFRPRDLTAAGSPDALAGGSRKPPLCGASRVFAEKNMAATWSRAFFARSTRSAVRLSRDEEQGGARVPIALLLRRTGAAGRLPSRARGSALRAHLCGLPGRGLAHRADAWSGR